MGDLERYGFEIEGYKGFQELMRKSPDRFAKALVRGTSRSLGAFRREFLDASSAKIQGRRSNPKPGSRARNIGSSFRYETTPRNAAEATGRTREIGGVIYTTSKAAVGLELGGTVRPVKAEVLAIPFSVPGGDNRNAKGGIKPSWKNLGVVLKKKGYRFFFIKKASGTVVMAQKRPTLKDQRQDIGPIRAAPPFPVFLLTENVELDPGRLNYFSTWDSYSSQGGVDSRFMKEIDKELADIERDRRGR